MLNDVFMPIFIRKCHWIDTKLRVKFDRLSCQLIVSDDLEGLTVHMPEKQV